MPRSRKESTDRLLHESQELLSGVEEESEEVTARHDIDDVNGDGRPKMGSHSELEVTGPGGLKMKLAGFSGPVVVSLMVILVVVGVGVFGKLKGWW